MSEVVHAVRTADGRASHGGWQGQGRDLPWTASRHDRRSLREGRRDRTSDRYMGGGCAWWCAWIMDEGTRRVERRREGDGEDGLYGGGNREGRERKREKGKTHVGGEIGLKLMWTGRYQGILQMRT